MPPTSAPSATLSAIADRAEQVMRQQRTDTQTGVLRLPTRVEGRVFRRLHLFAHFPHDIKAQADAVAVHLGSPQTVDSLFSHRHWSIGHHARAQGRAVGPVVRGDALVRAILSFLVRSRAANASEHTAQQLAETLVLSGFISPVHEPKDEPMELDSPVQPAANAYVTPRGYYELVSSAVLHAIQTQQQPPPYEQQQAERLDDSIDSKTGLPRDAKLSVWDVVDGATRAGQVFRKQPPSLLHRLVASLSLCQSSRGLPPPQGHEKQHYVVVNHRHRAVFVFRDDVARQAIVRVPLRDAVVQMERGGAMYHGLTLRTDDHTERFDFTARHDQLAWLLALLDGGARYKESHREIDRIVAAPFYTQRDVLVSGETVVMGDLVRGRVVVLVNVASKDPEAELQWPELLAMAETYHSDGVVVVACPSDQFLGLELASDREIASHLRETTAATRRIYVLAKRDVNGPRAREPFLYCNAHLPGAFGPFTEWNFTKFLLDRAGKPYRRYETRVLPQEMEGDVRRLLGLHRPGRHRPHRRPNAAPASPVGIAQAEEELRPARVAQEIAQATHCERPGCEGDGDGACRRP